MEFWNQEHFSEWASNADLFYGVIEYDKGERAYMPIAGFMYEQDAKDYCEYLATTGRKAQVVDLLHVLGIH